MPVRTLSHNELAALCRARILDAGLLDRAIYEFAHSHDGKPTALSDGELQTHFLTYCAALLVGDAVRASVRARSAEDAG